MKIIDEDELNGSLLYQWSIIFNAIIATYRQYTNDYSKRVQKYIMNSDNTIRI